MKSPLWFVLGSIATLAASAFADTPYSGLGASSLPPETIAKYAPKPIPDDLSRRIQSMLDVRAPGLGVPSPDGSRLFFGWRVTGIGQVWRLDGPNQFPVQLTGGEDATTLEDVTPDGKTLIVSRDRKGEENPGLYTMPTEGGPLQKIQHVAGVQTLFDFVTSDGKWVYFHSNDRQKDALAIYRWGLVSHRRELVFAQPGLWNVADYRPDGRLLLRKSTGSLSAEYSEWNPSTRATKPLLGQGETTEYNASYGAADGQLIVLTPKFGEFRRLYAWSAGKFTPITPEQKWDVSGFQIDPARKHLLYTVNEAGYTRLFALNGTTLQSESLHSLPAGADHVYSGSTTRDGRFVTLGVETATAPRTSYVYDWTSGNLQRWVVPSAPEIDTRTFSPAKLEYCTARDGAKIPMFVRRPAKCGSEPCPVVVEFHGGPEGQAQPGFSVYAQLFVDAGYVFIQPNVRGSDGYGKEYLNADNGPKRLEVITDLEDVARYARKTFTVRGKEPKVGVVGGSYGGYATLMAMTRFAGDYDCGVSIVGFSNLVTFLNNTAPYRRVLRTTEYGDPEKDHDALVQLSPITYINRLKAPLLIIQGVSDPRVPVGESIQMYEAAKKTRAPSELILFADEGHGAAKRENQVLQLGHMLQWLHQYLGPSASSGASMPSAGAEMQGK
jgi:dipeptidyl aminopeptidase/acylaminoacyl peptidase